MGVGILILLGLVIGLLYFIGEGGPEFFRDNLYPIAPLFLLAIPVVVSLLLPFIIIFAIIKLSGRRLRLLNNNYDTRSGQGRNASIPSQVAGWSWGAAVLSWIWGAYHGVWISLLSLVPFVNLVWWLVLGIKGREWAWRAQAWESVEHFEKSQKKWDNAGLLIVSVYVLLMILGLLLDS